MGKTSVALQLAKEFQTVIISADSRQIYREMTIGTAKPTPEEQREVRHYFIDTHSVGDDYNAARYADQALAVIHERFLEQNHVIVCGGSGLYIRAVCEGFDDIPPVPDEIRRLLVQDYRHHGLAWLQEEVRRRDPEAFRAVDIRNPHRLIRALEVKIYSGQSILSFRSNQRREHPFRITKVGLELPREELYRRIDSRMDQMIADGLFDEAKALYPLRHHNALQTVGYQEIFGYMDGAYDLDECIRLLKRNSRRYAKRQLTWFKKDPEFRWFGPAQIDDIVKYVRSSKFKV